MPSFSNTQDLVEIDAIRNDIVVLKSGAMEQVLIVGGTNFALKSEEEQKVLVQTYQNFLNSLNFPIQILIHSRKLNIEKYLATLAERRSQEPSPLLQDQTMEYEEFIRGFVQEHAIMTKTFLVVVPFTPIGMPSKEAVSKFLPSLPFFGKKKEAPKKKDEGERAANDEVFTENALQLRQRVSQVVDGLAAVGLEAAPLKANELVELFYNFYNPETTEREDIPTPKEAQSGSGK